MTDTLTPKPSDKEKLLAFARTLSNIARPHLSSREAQDVLISVERQISDIAKYVACAAAKL